MPDRKIICLALACLLLQGCSSWWLRKDYSNPLPAGQVALRKITDPARIPDFRRAFNNPHKLVASIDHSLTYFNEHPSSQAYFPYLDVGHSRAVKSLERFKRLLAECSTADEFHRRLVEDFDVYESVGCDDRGTVLFTGYCTPIYEASLTPSIEFKYPLYKLPPDLVKRSDGVVLGRRTEAGGIVPYYTRLQIEQGERLKGLELVYLRDRLEAFLVHVQGSALLRLRDGKMMEVGYAGKNGRSYSSLGRMLGDDRKIHRDRVSLTTIKEYFRANPQDLDTYLPRNESYIFFRETQGGPFGSLGRQVTAYCSIATDKNKDPSMSETAEIYPRGCLAFVETKLPSIARSDGRVEKRPYSGFALDQDTGGAIRSAGRCDIYLGTGRVAELLAGHTVAEGRLYYLFIKRELIQREL